MGARRIRREQRAFDMALSRRTNGMLKDKERARRAVRMAAIIKAGTFPYTPSVQSWISAQLDKPTSRVTQADVDQLLARK